MAPTMQCHPRGEEDEEEEKEEEERI